MRGLRTLQKLKSLVQVLGVSVSPQQRQLANETRGRLSDQINLDELSSGLSSEATITLSLRFRGVNSMPSGSAVPVVYFR